MISFFMAPVTSLCTSLFRSEPDFASRTTGSLHCGHFAISFLLSSVCLKMKVSHFFNLSIVTLIVHLLRLEIGEASPHSPIRPLTRVAFPGSPVPSFWNHASEAILQVQRYCEPQAILHPSFIHRSSLIVSPSSFIVQRFSAGLFRAFRNSLFTIHHSPPACVPK